MAPPAQKSKSTNTLLIVLGLLGVCCIGSVVALFFGGRALLNQAGPLVGCMLNFKTAQEAIRSYAMAHDGKLPNAKTWQDDIAKYYDQALSNMQSDKNKMPDFMKVPTSTDQWGCLDGPDKRTGMAFNVALSGKKLADIKDPYHTVLIFETEKVGRNLSEQYQAKPKSSGPKILGAPRDWVTAPVEGDIKAGKNGQVNFGN